MAQEIWTEFGYSTPSPGESLGCIQLGSFIQLHSAGSLNGLEGCEGFIFNS